MTSRTSDNALLTIEQDGPVCVITLRHAPVNAMSSQLRAGLTAVFNSLVTSDAAVVLLRGEGKGFCAGADLKEFAGRRGDTARTSDSLSNGQRFWESVYDIQIPVVAAMHGFAVGAGLVLASMCDIRLASQSCMFSMPEIAVGISVAGGGAQMRRLGLREGFIRDLILNGHKIDTAVAAREGLIDHVLPDEDFAQASLEWATDLARHGRDALLAMKTALNLTESVPDWRAGNSLTRSLSLGFVETKLAEERATRADAGASA
ncbi:enoyl-CoA hydratase [Nocardioides sp. AN3]